MLLTLRSYGVHDLETVVEHAGARSKKTLFKFKQK